MRLSTIWRSPISPRAISLAVYFPALVATAVVACHEQPKPATPPAFGRVFPNLPLPPNPSFVSRAGGADALQLTLRSTENADAVAKYYRGVFSKADWKLVNEAKDQDGAIVLYAVRKGSPLWVRVRTDSAGSGSFVELAGAVVQPDSAKAGHDSASSKSSNRSQRG